MWKPVLIFSAVVLLILVPASRTGLSSQEPASGKAPVKATTDGQAKAKKLYNVDCAMCHSEDGSGKSEMAKDMGLSLLDWTDASKLAGKTDKDLFDAIRHGKGDKMPAEAANRAKDEEIWQLVLYIRSFQGKGSAAPAAPAADRP